MSRTSVLTYRANAGHNLATNTAVKSVRKQGPAKSRLRASATMERARSLYKEQKPWLTGLINLIHEARRS